MTKVDVIGLDADDTLWHNETLFSVTQQRFAELLEDHADPDHLQERMLATESRNLKIFGYGAKGFTLSMIETALEVTGGDDTNGRVWGSGGGGAGGRARIVESAIRAGQRKEVPDTGAQHLALRVGDDVRHQKFGEGVILDLQGSGDKAEARVRFRDVGEKTLLLSWAPLEKLP